MAQNLAPTTTLKLFAGSAPTTDVGQFGSEAAAAPQYSLNPDVIMQLAAWAGGWAQAVVGADRDQYLEDLNGYCYVMSWQVGYLFQEGVAEWKGTVTYNKGSLVKSSYGGSTPGQLFVSLVDANLNNPLPAGASNAYWMWATPPAAVLPSGLASGAIPKSSGPSSTGAPGSAGLVASNLSDLGTAVATAVPIQFQDGSQQSTAARAVTAQNVVTASRAMNTIFRNTGTRPLFCMVTVGINGGNSGGSGATAYTDSSASPTTAVGSINAGDQNMVQSMFFIVLPGNYYKVQGGGSYGLSSWTEWN